MKKLFINTVLLLFISLSTLGQNKMKSFNFKKGEILDILLLSTFPETSVLYDKYKTTAFSVAFEYTYQPQLGFAIKKLVIGNGLPSSLIIGKWKNKTNREGFLNNIVRKVPDFHEQRRALFSSFELTYYEMPEDVNFSVNSNNYNVATALWGVDDESFKKFYEEWEKEVEKYGGKLIVKFTNGISPTGYYYNADVFCIIEWDTKESFEDFTKKHPLQSYEDLKTYINL